MAGVRYLLHMHRLVCYEVSWLHGINSFASHFSDESTHRKSTLNSDRLPFTYKFLWSSKEIFKEPSKEPKRENKSILWSSELQGIKESQVFFLEQPVQHAMKNTMSIQGRRLLHFLGDERSTISKASSKTESQIYLQTYFSRFRLHFQETFQESCQDSGSRRRRQQQTQQDKYWPNTQHADLPRISPRKLSHKNIKKLW